MINCRVRPAVFFFIQAPTKNQSVLFLPPKQDSPDFCRRRVRMHLIVLSEQPPIFLPYSNEQFSRSGFFNTRKLYLHVLIKKEIIYCAYLTL